MVPLSSLGPMADGNMPNISSMIPINISWDPGRIENVYIEAECSHAEIEEYTELFKELCDIFAWSYNEMPRIDPHIVEHEIKTYPNAKPVRQRLRAVNPRKAPAIKAEIEKLLKSSFIYLVPLMEWVSNPIVMERNSYGLGYHNKHLDSRNQSFPICNRNKMSNTKGSNLVPSPGRLK